MDDINAHHLTRLKEPFLFAAACGGRAEEVESLIEFHGADVNWRSPSISTDIDRSGNNSDDDDHDNEELVLGDSVLLAAVKNGHTNVVEVLLAHGADVQSRCSSSGDTVLHIAAARGDEDLCELITETYSNRDLAFCVNDIGETPISIASKQGFQRLCDRLKYAPLEVALQHDPNTGMDQHFTQHMQIIANSDFQHSEKESLSPSSLYSVKNHESFDPLQTLKHAQQEGINELQLHALHSLYQKDGDSTYLVTADEKNSKLQTFFDDVESNCSFSYGCSTVSDNSVRRCIGNKISEKNLNSSFEKSRIIEFEKTIQEIEMAPQNETLAQITGLLLMVKQLRVEKYILVGHAKEQDSKCRMLENNIAKLEKQEKIYDNSLKQVQIELNSFKGINLDSKTVKDLELLEGKLLDSLKQITDAKGRALAIAHRENEDSRLCVICREEKKSVLLMPCRHLCCCNICSRRNELTHCPLCRDFIDQKICVYA